MFSKVLIVSGLIASFAMQGYAHAVIVPELGITGTPKSSNVFHPNNDCGSGADLAAIDTSTALPISNGVVSGLTITNFNPGSDGSRSIKSVFINSDGTGKTFVAANVTQNGEAKPTNVGSEPLTVKLPDGTVCNGGKDGNRCLLSLTTTSGFGNCVVLTSSAASDAVPAAAESTTAKSTAATSTAAAATTTAAKSSSTGNCKATKKQRRRWVAAKDHN